ncbi:unnamed protein product [Calicophoron daubneyi]|uniref:Uncharacterized protein n=1 Tax=Calicophoron daubneyi TaxID=300641 RepID=A0AAV2T991_CALDB
MSLLDILRSGDEGFHENLDDTLISKLCYCLACPSCNKILSLDFSSSDFVDSVEHILTYFVSDSQIVQPDDHRLSLLKIVVYLVLTHVECFPEMMSRIQELFIQSSNNNERILLLLLEAIVCCCNKAGPSTDVDFLDAFCTPLACERLYMQLRRRTNHYKRILITSLFCHLTLRHQNSSNSKYNEIDFLPIRNSCMNMDEDGRLFLRTLHKISSGFHTPTVPVLIDSEFPLTSEDLRKMSLEDKVDILDIMCMNSIEFTKSGPSDVIHLFKSSGNLSVICTKVIRNYFGRRTCAAGPLWPFILELWSKSVSECLTFSRASELYPLIEPFCRNRIPDLPSGSLDSLTPLLCDFLRESVRGAYCQLHEEACRYRTWVISTLTAFVSDSLCLAKLTEWNSELRFRIKTLSLQNLSAVCNEFKSLLVLSTRVCTLLTSTDFSIALAHIQFMVDIAWGLADPVLIYFAECIQETLCSASDDQKCQFADDLRRLLLRFLSRSLKIKYEDEDELENDKIQQIRAILPNLALLEPVSEWSDVSTSYFISIASFLTSEDAIASKLKELSDVRGLMLCLLITWMISRFHKSVSGVEAQIPCHFNDWLLNVTTALTDYELTEFMDSYKIMYNLRNRFRLLKELFDTDPDERFQPSLVRLYQRITESFGADFCIEEADSNKCPSCGESMTEIIENILITRSGSMTVDCVGG